MQAQTTSVKRSLAGYQRGLDFLVDVSLLKYRVSRMSAFHISRHSQLEAGDGVSPYFMGTLAASQV